MKEMENKIAVVTSASRGIGLACAVKLAQEGAHVFLAVRRVEDTVEICAPYREAGLSMTPVYFDATIPETYQAAVDRILEQAGRIDILVNNFGIGRPQQDLDLVGGSQEAFFEILELNLGSVYRLSKLVIPHMASGSSVVNISSIGGMIPDVTRIGYGVSKSAVNNLTQQIALQYAHLGIRCNAVLPGLTATDAAMKHMPQTFLDSFLSHVPLGRIGTPEDIAEAVCFLSGTGAGYITGHLLDVAGGYGLGTPQYSEFSRKQL